MGAARGHHCLGSTVSVEGGDLGSPLVVGKQRGLNCEREVKRLLQRLLLAVRHLAGEPVGTLGVQVDLGVDRELSWEFSDTVLAVELGAEPLPVTPAEVRGAWVLWITAYINSSHDVVFGGDRKVAGLLSRELACLEVSFLGRRASLPTFLCASLLGERDPSRGGVKVAVLSHLECAIVILLIKYYAVVSNFGFNLGGAHEVALGSAHAHLLIHIVDLDAADSGNRGSLVLKQPG